MRNVFGAVALSCASVVLASCGGGGGSSSSGGSGGGGGGVTPPTPSPTPVGRPYALPSASPNSLSVFSINSNPTALPVKIDNVNVGSTPATASPAYANSPHTISITAPGTTPPYVVVTGQTANGPHQVFYNSVVDTFGKITSLTPGSIVRHPQSMPIARLAPNFVGRASYSSTRLAVTYSSAALGNRSVDALERKHGVASAVTLSQSGGAITRAVDVSGSSIDAARRGLLAEPGVTSVDRVALRYPLGNVYPNDTHFNDSEQWDMYRIGAPGAWGLGLGSASIKIAVIDTGYDPNQTEVAPNVTYSERVLSGAIDTNAGAATDTNGHGTVVSAIASAVTNNGAGFAGVGYGTKLLEFKIYGDSATLNPTADTADESEAIREAVANHANVILLPLGGSAANGPDPLERDAVAYAIANNVTVVAASGDERASGVTTVDFPAALDGVISVGASAVNDANTPGDGIASPLYVASYSNSGPGLTMVAPGGDASSQTDTDQVHFIENAYTTQPFSGIPACATPSPASSCYAKFTGTSMAAAHVAGAAALVLAHANLTPAKMKTLLAASADDIADPLEGAGSLDINRALAAATGNPPPAPKYTPTYNQFIAFAYTNIGQQQNVPVIADVTYPRGVPVAADGTFRIGDLPANIGSYRIAVWYDSNANGVIDAGDYFAVVANPCAHTGACSGANALAVHAVPASPAFVLP